MERRTLSVVQLGALAIILVVVAIVVYSLARPNLSTPAAEAVGTATPAPPTTLTAAMAEVPAEQPASPLAALQSAARTSSLASPLATPVFSLTHTLTATLQFTRTTTPTATLIVTPSVTTALTLPLVIDATGQVPVYSYEVVNSFPHDPNAFTQGLVWEDGLLYEGTGLNRRSSLRKVDLETGKVLQSQPLAGQYFGEGIVIWGERIYQLTWQSEVGFVYDKDSFSQLSTFTYPTEGWGLTHDGKRLIMSDGTFVLYFRSPDSFAEIGRIHVMDGSRPIVRLNELEYVEGEVFANIWQTDRIARIDPDTGAVVGWIDLTGLLPPQDRAGQQVDVLNGIAYDDANDRLFVTGKLWPKLFEIRLVEPSQP
jgi:glutamine cyclotransferase